MKFTPEQKEAWMKEYGVTQSFLDGVNATIRGWRREQILLFLLGYFLFFIMTNYGVQLFWLTFNIGYYFRRKIRYENEIMNDLIKKKKEKDKKKAEQDAAQQTKKHP